MMELAMGGLEWAPAVFWSATPHEMFAAIEGKREANGYEEPLRAPTPEEVAAMMKRFPDTVH